MNDYPLRSIYMYLTDGCNLNCCHCWLSPIMHNDDNCYACLDFNLIAKCISEAKPLGLKTIKLTGGEPLLHPNILKILDLIKHEDLRPIIETNGTLITPELVTSFKQFDNISISISLDAMEPAMHDRIRGVKSSFSKAIHGVKMLIDSNIKPEIIMTLMKINKSQIKSMTVFVEDLGLTTLKINVLQVSGRAERLLPNNICNIEELIDIGSWIERILSKESNIRIIYDHPPAFRLLSNMFADNDNGCSVCKIKEIMGILPDGSVSLCGIGKLVPELLLGNINEDSIIDIWEKSSILNNLRTDLPSKLKGVCSRCVMQSVCSGACIAQNYYQSKDIFSSFWYCEQAYEKGLFPSTRIIPE